MPLSTNLSPVPISTSAPMVRLASTNAFAAVQLLAILTMVIDHLGAMSLLGDWSRLVGRVSLPAFVLMIGCNALATSRPCAMLVRCVLLLLLSLPLWWLTVGTYPAGNIMVTLSVVVALCWCWRNPTPLGYLAFLLVSLVFLIVAPVVEYSWFPLLLLPLVLVPSLPTLVLALSWPFFQYLGFPAFQVSALVGLLLVLVLLRFPVIVPRLPRVLTRWFYPGHLAALATMV